jgi:hypothetical protein
VEPYFQRATGVVSEDSLGAREDRLRSLGVGARLADGVGQERNIHRVLVRTGTQRQLAERDLGELQHCRDALQNAHGDVRPFLESSQVAAADAGHLGEPRLGEPFLESSFANALTEHRRNF